MNTAHELRSLLTPRPYTASPYQWGYVAAVHPATSTTLSANVLAGAASISTVAALHANDWVVVGTGGPVQIESVTGAGPFTALLAARGAPNPATAGAVVLVVPTLDVYFDGWQNPPANLPTGVAPILTTGVRFGNSYAPAVGHSVLCARGTGLQRSDRVVIDRLASGGPTGKPVGDCPITGPSPIGALTGMTLGTPDIDNVNGFGGGVYTVRVGGPYEVYISWLAGTLPGGTLNAGIFLNGVNGGGKAQASAGAGATTTADFTSKVMLLKPGDTIQPVAASSGASPLTVNPIYSFMTVKMVG